MSKAVKLTVGAGGASAKKKLDLTCHFVRRELSLICAPVPGLLFIWCKDERKRCINKMK